MGKEELFIFSSNDYFLNMHMVTGDNLSHNVSVQYYFTSHPEKSRNTFNLYMLKIQWGHAQTEETWPIYNVNFILF